MPCCAAIVLHMVKKPELVLKYYVRARTTPLAFLLPMSAFAQHNSPPAAQAISDGLWPKVFAQGRNEASCTDVTSIFFNPRV